MKSLFIILLMSISMTIFCQKNTFSVDKIPAIDSLFNSQLNKKVYRGASFVLVENGIVIYKKGYGFFDPEKHLTVSPDSSVFSTASISKIFASISLLQLQEKGMCNMNDPVSKYLKKGTLNNPYPTPVTLKNLSTHTAGFENKFAGALVSKPSELTPLDKFYALRMPCIVMEPGTQISYSNLGAGLAGLIAQNISGLSYNKYVQENIFTPLGMNHSSFFQPPSKDLQSLMINVGKQPYFNPYPAASCVTTASDMGKLLEALMNDNNPILSAASLKQIFSQQWSPSPEMPGMGLGFMQSWLNNQDGYFHTGDAGQHSEIFLIPSKKFGFYVVYTNLSENEQNPREILTRLLLNSYWPSTPLQLKKDPGISNSLIEYEGTFWINMYSHSNFEKMSALLMQGSCKANSDGTLFLTPMGGSADTLYPAGKDLFRIKDGSYAFFGRNKDGKVNRITISGSISDPTGLEKREWYDNSIFHFLILGLVILAILSRMIIALKNTSGRKNKTQNMAVVASQIQKWAWKLSGIQTFLIAALPLIAIVGLAITPKPFFGIPSFVFILLNLLILIAIVSLAIGCCCVLSWKDNYWSKGRRIYYTFFSVIMLLFAWFIQYWNL